MKSLGASLMALFLIGCGDSEAASDRWCEEFYARFDVSELVNQRTGRVDRDPTTNEVVDSETGRVALTRREEECVQRQAQKTINAYEGN